MHNTLLAKKVWLEKRFNINKNRPGETSTVNLLYCHHKHLQKFFLSACYICNW